MFRSKSLPIIVALVVACLALLDFLAHDVWGADAQFRPLVQTSEFAKLDGFDCGRIPISPLEAPLEITQNKSTETCRTWTPRTGGTTGELITEPFVVPRYLAVTYTGFPGERPGNSLVLKCDVDGRQQPVASLRTNTQWATVFLAVSEFCPGPVRLVASVASNRHYIGVATPYAVPGTSYWVHTSYVPRAVVVVLTWALLLLIGLPAAHLAQRHLPSVPAVAAGLVGVGTAGMLALTAFTFSAVAGKVVALFIVAAALVWLVSVSSRERDSLRRIAREAGPPAILWLGVAVLYTATISSMDSGGGSWAVNGLFTPLRWSSDNQLPMALAEALFDGTPRHTITAGPWLATDRGPLLAALLTFPRVLLAPVLPIFGTSFMSIAYTLSAVTIIASWAALLPSFCRTARAPNLGIVAAIAVASPFLLFNTVYVWPKILGATYVVIAFLLLLLPDRPDKGRGQVLTMIAVSASLGVLAHASNAFALIPLAAYFFRRIVGRGLAAVAIAAAAAVIVYAPWAYWQLVVQPGGNALLRFFLTGNLNFHVRQPVIPDVVATYQRLGLTGWLSQKSQTALQMLNPLGIETSRIGEVSRNSPNAGLLGTSRVLDFFVVSRTLALPVFGLAALAGARALMGRVQPELGQTERIAFVVGLSGIVLTWAVSLAEQHTHHQAYGSVLLVLLAGAAAISKLPVWMASTLASTAVIYTVATWLVSPLMIAARTIESGIVGIALGAVLLVMAISQDRDAQQATHHHADLD